MTDPIFLSITGILHLIGVHVFWAEFKYDYNEPRDSNSAWPTHVHLSDALSHSHTMISLDAPGKQAL